MRPDFWLRAGCVVVIVRDIVDIRRLRVWIGRCCVVVVLFLSGGSLGIGMIRICAARRGRRLLVILQRVDDIILLAARIVEVVVVHVHIHDASMNWLAWVGG